MFWGQSTLTFKVKFKVNVKVYPIWACPHYNSSPIQARITKFGPDVQNTLVKIPIVWVAIDLNLQGQIWL